MDNRGQNRHGMKRWFFDEDQGSLELCGIDYFSYPHGREENNHDST
jgi:hypothetical protein